MTLASTDVYAMYILYTTFIPMPAHGSRSAPRETSLCYVMCFKHCCQSMSSNLLSSNLFSVWLDNLLLITMHVCLQAQKGLLLALEDCSLLVLTATDYQSILLNGFDGQLNAKLSVLKCCSALMSCISSNSDIRGLAYAAVCEQHGWGGHVYAAGQVPQALYVLQEGSCRVGKITDCHLYACHHAVSLLPLPFLYSMLSPRFILRSQPAGSNWPQMSTSGHHV